jgi:ribosomal protein L10
VIGSQKRFRVVIKEGKHMARPDKEAAVAELTEDFRSASATVLTEYRGLTVTSMKALRRSLGAEYQVLGRKEHS